MVLSSLPQRRSWEAGDECAHEKLREDKFHRWCGDTSLQASSGGTRTSPRTEPWSAMPVGVLLSVFFRASSGGCRRRWRDSLLSEWAEQRQRWASGGLAKKLAGGKNKAWRHCRAQRQARLGSGNSAEGLPFYTSRERNGHPNRLR
jgi:hypothetical protein